MSRIRTPLSDSRNAASSQPRTSSRNNYVVEDDNSDYCSIDSSDEDDGDSAESDDNTSASDGYDNYNSSNSSESVSRVNSNVTGSIRSISSLGSGNNEYRKGRNHRGDLTTIDERSEDDDGSSEEGSSSGSSSGSSQSSSDSDSDSDSEGSSEGSSDSQSESGTDDDYNEDTRKSKKSSPRVVAAQPMAVLNAIACALFEPGGGNGDDDSYRSGQSVGSDSDSDSDNEGGVVDGESNVDLGAYSRQERDRAHSVFNHCTTVDKYHLNEDQFGVALALLGQTEKKEDLKILYDDLAISDGLSIDGFMLALNRLRQKGHEEESLKRILEAFNALYDGTCLNDDQKDFSGQRYIYANDFRLLLTTTGSEIERLTDEEANELIRECKPIYPKVRNSKTDKEEDDGPSVAVLKGKIFYDQYRAMLLDKCP